MDPVRENVLVERLVDLPADADIPIVASAPERTWLWSDLPLSDPSVLLGWRRPFRSVEEMNRHLLLKWRRRVGTGDTVICLGDIAPVSTPAHVLVGAQLILSMGWDW